MNEYALIVGGEFCEIRRYPERPENIPHKAIVWLPVTREYGEPFEGVDGDAYMIRTVDPATLPPPVPNVVSPRQARLALLSAGKLDAVNAAVAEADAATRIAWEFATEVRRDDAGVIALAAAIGIAESDLDALFINAAQL